MSMTTTDLTEETILDLEFEPEDDIPCEAFQCFRRAAHPAEWDVVMTCGHHLYGCEKARKRWEILDKLMHTPTHWDCPVCHAKVALVAVYPVGRKQP